MAASAQPGATVSSTAAPAELARACLLRLITQHGLAICADPWRCEALLRDGCSDSRREIFWLVSALRQNIVSDIRAARRDTSEPILQARLSHKLGEELGLAQEPAQWTAQVWLDAVRTAPAGNAAEPLATRPPLPAWPEPGPVLADAWAPLPTGVDFRWIGLCLSSLVLSGLALELITRVAFAPAALAPRPWLRDTLTLAVGLAMCAALEFALVHAARRGPACRPAPQQAPWALAPELLSLLAQPAVLVAGVIIWIGGWIGAVHAYGPGGNFTFTLGRVVQSFLLGAFFYKWADWMTQLQGRVATTLVRIQP